MVTKVPQILIEDFQQAITDAVAAELSFDIADYSTTAQMNAALALKADADAVTAALADKADADDINAAIGALSTSVSADIAAVQATVNSAKELSVDFVASGAIGAGKFVALRSDGKVEEVTGSETLLSLGTAVQFESSTSATILDAKYNAATAKVAILYRINTAYWLIVGTVSGSTITFGTAITFGAVGPNSTEAKIAWRSDGSKIIAIYGTTSSVTMNAYVVTVTGTTLAAGSQGTFSASSTTANVNFLTWDSVADRIVGVVSSDYAFAGTVSGTTLSTGAPQAFAITSAVGWHYNETAARLIMWDLQATQTVRAATISGTTITMGTAVTNPSLLTTSKVAAAGASSDLVIVGNLVSNGPFYVNVASFSGNTVTYSAATKLTDIASNDANAVRVVYSPSDTKFVISQIETSSRSANHEGARFWVVTVSAVAPSLSAQTVAPDFFAATSFAFLDDGTAVLWGSLTSKFAGLYQLAGKIIGGVFVLDTKGTLQSSLPSVSSAIWVTIPGTCKFVNCYAATQRYALVETAASFTTNAHNWFGVADAPAADGATVSIKLRDAVAGGQTGLTVGSPYYLAPNGTISANDNGRPVGVAISATKLRLAA